MDRACAPSTAGRAEGRAVRHQIRGRLDDAGCVAPPRNSANYSSSSRLASLAEPPPTLATDFRSGTLAPRRRAPPGDGEQRERRREYAHPDEQRARAPTARVRDQRDVGA